MSALEKRRVLITGASGFVSRHFIDYLESQRIPAEVLGVSRSAPAFDTASRRFVRCSFRALDLLDRRATHEVLQKFAPDYIVHLAACSSVGFSWQAPVESFANNTNIFLNLLEEVRALPASCRILSVGSSEQYGSVEPSALPLREDAALSPLSPYAVARVSQELLSSVYVRGYGLDIVMTRSFNHTGPFQRDAFVISSLARQLVAIARGKAPPRLVTGDRSIVRDFVDVRDVVRAYYELLARGRRGEIYNVCTGRGVSIEGVIDIMQKRLGTRAELFTDERLIRPSDNRVIVGSYDKLHGATGWAPQFTLTDSIHGVVDWWSQTLAEA